MGVELERFPCTREKHNWYRTHGPGRAHISEKHIYGNLPSRRTEHVRRVIRVR